MRFLRGLYRDLLTILPEDQRAPEALGSKVLDPNRPTVVFVSGFGAPSRALGVIRRRFVRDGFNVVLFSLHWQYVSGGIADMARELSREVLVLRKLVGSRPVHLVAHSAGGIVARYYVQILGGSHYCDSLITLATPHRGTWLSLLGFLSHLAVLGRCLVQMSPRSSVIRSLNAAPVPTDIRWLSVFSSSDWLCPAHVTQIPTEFQGLGHVRSMMVSGLSHADFVLSKRGYLIIKRSLETASSPDDVFAAVHA